MRLIRFVEKIVSADASDVVMSSQEAKKVLTVCLGLHVAQRQVISRCRTLSVKGSRLFDKGMIACKALHGQFDIDEKAIGNCREVLSRLVGNKGQPEHRQVALSLQIVCTVRMNIEDARVQVRNRPASCGYLLCRMRCDVIQGVVVCRHKQLCFQRKSVIGLHMRR